MDISILLNDTNKRTSSILTIEPLAPLSLVSSLPGSFYKSEYAPSKFMLCGLFENLLGWHFSIEDRKCIIKELKKQYKQLYKTDLCTYESNVGYVPLIHHLFDIQLTITPHIETYIDVWTQHLIGGDERHLKGVINYDWRLESAINQCEDTIPARNELFNTKKSLFPKYYRSVPKREFLFTKGDYIIKLNIQQEFHELLKSTIKQNDCGYLGTSEGWVNVIFEEIV